MNQNTNPTGNPIITNVTLDTGGGTHEFDRFEDLTSKLVQVSKAEVDEKRKGSGS